MSRTSKAAVKGAGRASGPRKADAGEGDEIVSRGI